MSDHSGDADDVSGITWPGFVDIMSSVIMMFIFFVLITAVALYFHTITYKSKLLAQIQQMADTQSEEKTKTLKQEAIEAQEKVEEVTAENKVLIQKISEYQEKLEKTDSKFAESKDQKIIVDEGADSVTLFFGKDAISLTEQTNHQLEEFISAFMAKAGTEDISVNITGNKNPLSVTESVAREMALARMMNSRNIFLKTTIPKEKIFVTMTNEDKIEDSYNWVKIKLVKN